MFNTERYVMSESPQSTMEWPYPIEYGEEKHFDTDVLVLGGGIAGCFAAIAAAHKGARSIASVKASGVTFDQSLLESHSGSFDRCNAPCLRGI